MLVRPTSVYESLEQDNMVETDYQKWYAVHKGCYLYIRDFKAEGSRNLEQVFDKMRLVRDTCLPSKGSEFGKEVNTIFAKYKEKEMSDEVLAELSDDLYQISEDIKKWADKSVSPD